MTNEPLGKVPSFSLISAGGASHFDALQAQDIDDEADAGLVCLTGRDHVAIGRILLAGFDGVAALVGKSYRALHREKRMRVAGQ